MRGRSAPAWAGALLSDRPFAGFLALAAALATVALAWSLGSDLALAYYEAQARGELARRVIDSRTPGIAQLGTVWLPLPALLTLPLAQVDPLWRSGGAGALVGLAAFVVTGAAIYRAIRLLTHSDAAAWAGGLLFALNPNALYIQTTALAEPLLMACLAVATALLIRWAEDGRPRSLMAASIAGGLAAGTLYDGWLFAALAAGLVLVITLGGGRGGARAEASAIFFAAIPAYVMLLWLLYNWLIFGDPLAFRGGEFAGQALFAGGAPAQGDLLGALLTYHRATRLSAGGVAMIVGAVGLIAYIGATRGRAASLAAYVVLAPCVSQVGGLYLGQTLIVTPLGEPAGFYNIRYGLLTLPALALFAGYLCGRLLHSRLSWLALPTFGLLLALQALLWAPGWPYSAGVIAEGLGNRRDAEARAIPAAASFLRAHYDGGGILIDEGRTFVITRAGLPIQEYLISANGPLWRAALREPQPLARWVVMQRRSAAPVASAEATIAADRVALSLAIRPDFHAAYRRVYAQHGLEIYRLGGATR